jgi:hypothetical protein
MKSIRIEFLVDSSLSSDSANFFSRYYSKDQLPLLERIPKCFLIMAACFVGIQLIGLSFLSEFEENSKEEEAEKKKLLINEENIESAIETQNDQDEEKNSYGIRFDPENDLVLKY